MDLQAFPLWPAEGQEQRFQEHGGVGPETALRAVIGRPIADVEDMLFGPASATQEQVRPHAVELLGMHAAALALRTSHLHLVTQIRAAEKRTNYVEVPWQAVREATQSGTSPGSSERELHEGKAQEGRAQEARTRGDAGSPAPASSGAVGGDTEAADVAGEGSGGMTDPLLHFWLGVGTGLGAQLHGSLEWGPFPVPKAKTSREGTRASNTTAAKMAAAWNTSLASLTSVWDLSTKAMGWPQAPGGRPVKAATRPALPGRSKPVVSLEASPGVSWLEGLELSFRGGVDSEGSSSRGGAHPLTARGAPGDGAAAVSREASQSSRRRASGGYAPGTTPPRQGRPASALQPQALRSHALPGSPTKPGRGAKREPWLDPDGLGVMWAGGGSVHDTASFTEAGSRGPDSLDAASEEWVPHAPVASGEGIAVRGLPGASPLGPGAGAPAVAVAAPWLAERLAEDVHRRGFRNIEVQRCVARRAGVAATYVTVVRTSAPYGASFRTLLRFSLRASGPSETALVIEFGVMYLKPVMGLVRGAINRGAQEGVRAQWASTFPAVLADRRVEVSVDAATVERAIAAAALNAAQAGGPSVPRAEDLTQADCEVDAGAVTVGPSSAPIAAPAVVEGKEQGAVKAPAPARTSSASAPSAGALSMAFLAKILLPWGATPPNLALPAIGAAIAAAAVCRVLLASAGLLGSAGLLSLAWVSAGLAVIAAAALGAAWAASAATAARLSAQHAAREAVLQARLEGLTDVVRELRAKIDAVEKKQEAVGVRSATLKGGEGAVGKVPPCMTVRHVIAQLSILVASSRF